MTHAFHVPRTSSGSRSTAADASRNQPGDQLVVIGVGNRDRGDDAVGPIVCDLIGQDANGVRTVVVEGNVLDLPLHWEPDDRVVIVDATPPAGRPGHLTVIDALDARLSGPAPVSTHAIDVGAAIELARALGRMPAELTIIGIEAASDEHGAELSDDVARAARCVAGRLAADRPF